MDGEISSDLVMQNLVLKRKRSQRQGPWNSLSSEDDNVDGGPMMITTTLSSSSMDEEEDEEHRAAKCLMLLAQGKYQTQFNSLTVSERALTKKSWYEKKKKKKINNGGLYECKTCNRTFQSFQALGGHRTSHKKIKIKSEESVLQKPVLKPSEQSYNNLIAPPKLRVHECLICNAVFASGQALGGHMRRHRVTVATSTGTETKSNGITRSLLTENVASRIDNDFQCLDLNLPIASDEIGQSQFCLGSKQRKQQQQLEDSSGLVFSTPAALVDCHY